MFKKAFVVVYVFALVGIVAAILVSSRTLDKSSGQPLIVKLRRDPLTVFEFPSKKTDTKSVIIFASGDGGWGDFEEAMAHALQANGYEVIGIDSVQYARTDYDLETLQADFTQIAKNVESSFGQRPPPLIVGGYSMGAAQAIAIAGGPHPPPGLIGVLLVDPCERGRYGLRTKDQMNVLPTGPGTFSMEDFSRTITNLRVVQWHAEKDSIDSRAWLNSLTAPHREYDFPGAEHDYVYDRDDFLHQFVDSVDWILNPTQAKTMATSITH
jgi:pimeloyl-ACP methyl ester carboxylesterase